MLAVVVADATPQASSNRGSSWAEVIRGSRGGGGYSGGGSRGGGDPVAVVVAAAVVVVVVAEVAAVVVDVGDKQTTDKDRVDEIKIRIYVKNLSDNVCDASFLPCADDSPCSIRIKANGSLSLSVKSKVI
jgi:hypothetical protein